MRNKPERWAELHRIKTDPVWGTTAADKNNGAFLIPYRGVDLRIQASDGLGWGHVSVSLADRCPTWAEMDYVKSLFWEPSKWVVQYHAPTDSKINICKTCLHLWKPINKTLPRPLVIMV